MRFLILNSDYPGFLADLYAGNPGLEDRTFEEQWQARLSTLFGVAGFYSDNLRELGHDAHEVLINNEHLQRAWAREYGSIPVLLRRPPLRRVTRGLSRWPRLTPPRAWMSKVLEQQIEHFQPDVILNQDICLVDPNLFKRLRTHYGRLIGQIASPLPDHDLACYDLMLSSLPNLVERFQSLGLPAELHRLGFEPHVLDAIGEEPRTIRCSFVGSISPDHTERLNLLEELSRRTPIEFWGNGINTIPRRSPLHSRYHGRAWGRDMYRILARSQITVNKHLDLSESHANNMRLYEATGMGTLLLTDWKDDLDEILAPGSEIAVYRTPDECVEQLMHFANDAERRQAVAAAGQRRTLTEHTYARRMAELVSIAERYA